MQTRRNAGPPGVPRRPRPVSAAFRGPERGAGGAETRPGRGVFRRTASPAARSSVSPKGPRLGSKLQLRARPHALPGPRLHCNRVSASRAYPELLEGKAKKETCGKTPCFPHRPPTHTRSPGSALAAASPSPSSEPADSPPPYCPPLRTKKAAGNPGLAGVQVISCFLMGSNSY